jgi:hypothetical protein
VRRDARRAAVLPAIILAAAGCVSVPPSAVTMPPPPSPVPPAAGSVPGVSAAIPGVLAAVADEGRVTYSVTLRPGQCHARDDGRLPDPACTPGSLDPRVTQASIGSTICRTGWTAAVRPPASATDRAKHDVAYPAYGIPAATPSELDHLVPLELGGSNDISNLWPQAGAVPNSKDPIENALRNAVCNGRVSLAEAQRAIATDWETAEEVPGVAHTP